MMASAALARWSISMSDSAARSRLLELLPSIIVQLERFLSDPAAKQITPFPLGIVELEPAAEYLAAIGLKPDGNWLLREYNFVVKTGFHLLESEKWATDPESARQLGYSVQWRGEPEGVRESRRYAIAGITAQLLERSRKLLEMVSDIQPTASPPRNAGESTSKTTMPPEPATSTTWQKVAEQLKRLHDQGQPWTSQQQMATQIGCSPATVNKAIQKTPELERWAKPQVSTAPRAQSLNDVDTDNRANREPNPADESGDAELVRKLTQEADSDERAFLQSIRNAPSDYQLWYISQPANTRASHRKAWKKKIRNDPTVKVWFLDRTLEEMLEFLNDPDAHEKILGRKA
jgi:hypothetical protein